MKSVDWDEAKRAQNLVKHKVNFLDAALIFEGPVAIYKDDRFDYGEIRFIAIGHADGQLFVVIYTIRSGARRLISARLGGRRDYAKYKKIFSGRTSRAEGRPE